MRVAAAALMSASLVAVAPSMPAWAEPPVAYVEAPQASTDPLRTAIDARLGQLEATNRSEQEQSWLDGLAEFYQARDFRPIWLDRNGDLTRLRSAAAEIARADDWGLDASQFRLPDLSVTTSDPQSAADAEVQMSLATLTYIAHARGHRVDPSQLSKWLDQRPKPVEATDVAEIADADDPEAALRRQHPQQPQFERLRQAYLKLRGGNSVKAVVDKPVAVPASGPRLKLGSEHADVAILRHRLGVAAADAEATKTYDAPLAAAVRAFQKKAGLKANGIVTNAVREALNDAGDGVGESDGASRKSRRGSITELKKLLVNMERWRWMPDDLGTIHVWNNLPEFETRVVKAGRVIHQERIIVGTSETQTPIFSDKMRFVVFNPDWGIPNSIKITDLLPRIRGGDSGVIERRDMRVVMNGRIVPSSSIDWSRVDIREVSIVQNPGASNPLGMVKFMFPNKHDVYMHDTPSKHLFNSAVRTFSHGCIRVRNPRALADLVFAEDRGWAPSQVGSMFSGPGKSSNKVDLNRQIDVHNTYFTIVASEDGSLKSLPDVYGHDRRIAMALDGTPTAVIARDDPAIRYEQKVKSRRIEVAARTQAQPAFRPGSRTPSQQWSPFFALGFN